MANDFSYTNSNIVDYMSRYVFEFPYKEDYVFYRTGDYQYRLYHGNIEFSGGQFTGSGLEYVQLDVPHNYGDSGYDISYGTGSLSWSFDGQMCYSSLDPFPELYTGIPQYYFWGLGIVLCISLVLSIIGKWFHVGGGRL